MAWNSGRSAPGERRRASPSREPGHLEDERHLRVGHVGERGVGQAQDLLDGQLGEARAVLLAVEALPTDETGSIRVRLPGQAAKVAVHVTLEWESPAALVEGGAWPPGSFDRTAGSVTDPTFARLSQAPLEPVEDLE